MVMSEKLTPTQSEMLTLSMVASHAKTLVELALKKVCGGNIPACGTTWRESLAQFDPVSLCWRTFQLSLIEAEQPSLPILPEWGMALDGLLFPLTPLAVRKSGFDGSFWRTPVASDTKARQVGNYIRRDSGHIAQDNKYRSAMRISQHVKAVERELGGVEPEGEINPRWEEQLMGLPHGWTSPDTSSRRGAGNLRRRASHPGSRRVRRRGPVKLRR